MEENIEGGILDVLGIKIAFDGNDAQICKSMLDGASAVDIYHLFFQDAPDGFIEVYRAFSRIATALYEQRIILDIIPRFLPGHEGTFFEAHKKGR